MQQTPYTDPQPVDTGGELIHTCARHPFIDQACQPSCRSYCGLELGDDSTDCGLVAASQDCCVVCESMFAAEYRR